MDHKEIKGRNDCTGEGQQQFNRTEFTSKKYLVLSPRWDLACVVVRSLVGLILREECELGMFYNKKTEENISE
jgi:hypothetical protein